MINQKSLFSSVRMDHCQEKKECEKERETVDLSSICRPAAFLAANSATSASLSPSSLLSSVSECFRGTIKQRKRAQAEILKS